MSDLDLSVYAKAAEIIGERGHNRQNWDDEDGSVCAEGAICIAVGCRGRCECDRCQPYVDQMALAAGFGLPTPLTHCHPELYRWNFNASAEDAILLLKHAAAGELDTWREVHGPGAE